MTEENFIRCYKYMEIDDGSLCVLTEGTLKYTCPLEFNDPFDCRPSYSKEALSKVGDTKKELIDAAAKRLGLSPAEKVQEKRKLAKKIENYVGTDEFVKATLSRIGVVSLSTDPQNILMWSHYADFHRGFVVGFKIPLFGTHEQGLDGGYNLVPFEVDYSQRRPEVHYGVDSPQAVLQKMVFTKSDHWHYENEQRVIEHQRGPGIHPYNRDSLLNSVIAGMNISKEDFQRLSEIVARLREMPEFQHLKLYKAEPSASEYKLDIPGLES